MNKGFLLDRYAGCLLGMAAGDALGMPAEGMTPYEVCQRLNYVNNFMPSPVNKQEDGTYTGVTQLALIQAMATVKDGKYDPDYAKSTCHDFVSKKKNRWGLVLGGPEHEEYARMGFDCIMAPTVMALKFSAKPSADMDLLRACGQVIRTCDHFPDKGRILESFCVMWMIKELIRNGGSLKYAPDIYLADNSIVGRLVDTCRTIEDKSGLEDGLWRKIDYARKKADEGRSVEEFAGMIHNGWSHGQAVPFALFCFMLQPDDIEALFMAVSCGGASPLVGAVVGALIGAYVGISFLSEDLRNELENSPRIIELSRRLCKIWAGEPEVV